MANQYLQQAFVKGREGFNFRPAIANQRITSSGMPDSARYEELIQKLSSTPTSSNALQFGSPLEFDNPLAFTKNAPLTGATLRSNFRPQNTPQQNFRASELAPQAQPQQAGFSYDNAPGDTGAIGNNFFGSEPSLGASGSAMSNYGSRQGFPGVTAYGNTPELGANPSMFGDFNLQDLSTGFDILGKGVNMFQGLSSLGLAKDQFNFQKEAYNKQSAMAEEDYRRRLADQQRTRAQFNGTAKA